jgi:hypothetical protein
MKNVIQLLLTITLIWGCSQGDVFEPGEGRAMAAEFELDDSEAKREETPDNRFTSESSQTGTGRKIIKNGFLEIKSNDISLSRQMIDSLTKKYNCYLADEGFHESSNRWTYNFTIRIEADSFDRFLNELLTGPDLVKNKSINTQDVTDQYYDLTARLEANLAVEKRYRELLNRAQNIKDILEIEKSMAQIRGEIESQQGRLSRLNNQISFSTLNISLYQEKTFKEASVARDPFSKRIVRSLIAGWDGFISFLIVFFSFWPFWIILIAGWRIIVYFIRKRKR